LTRQAGRNVLVVASEDRMVAPVLTAIAASLARGTEAQLFVLQGAKPTAAWPVKLPVLWRDLPGDLQVFDSRSAEACLKQVHELLQQRMQAGDSPAETSTGAGVDSHQAPPAVLLAVMQVGRLRELRRDDDFG